MTANIIKLTVNPRACSGVGDLHSAGIFRIDKFESFGGISIDSYRVKQENRLSLIFVRELHRLHDPKRFNQSKAVQNASISQKFLMCAIFKFSISTIKTCC